jgi:acetyl esterase/lipase
MKPLLFALCVVFAFGDLSAQQTTWQPSPGHTQVPIWPGAVPDQQPVAGPEAIYPGHLSFSAAEWDAKQGTKKFVVRRPPNADKELTLNPDIPVTSQTPPTFLLQAEDDQVDNVDDSLAYYIALKKAGVPVEVHLYTHGGHAFGLRRTKFPITEWPQVVETWLGTIGMISK